MKTQLPKLLRRKIGVQFITIIGNRAFIQLKSCENRETALELDSLQIGNTTAHFLPMIRPLRDKYFVLNNSIIMTGYRPITYKAISSSFDSQGLKIKDKFIHKFGKAFLK